MPCDVRALGEIADKHHLSLVEDAACAIGSEIEGVKIGRPHSRAACFSFHPRKLLTTGEGGLVTTGEPEIDERVRRLRQHGDFVEVGHNFRMTDLQAAVGRVQLGRLPSLLAERRRLAAEYRARLTLPMQREPSWARSNWQSLYVQLPVESANVAARLLGDGIATRPGIPNAHQRPHYAGGPRLPVSEEAAERGLMLPLLPGMDTAQIERVTSQLTAALR
jgi:dTDP-4-amino-4,6-dideoxygalactose transaminase